MWFCMFLFVSDNFWRFLPGPGTCADLYTLSHAPGSGCFFLCVLIHFVFLAVSLPGELETPGSKLQSVTRAYNTLSV